MSDPLAVLRELVEAARETADTGLGLNNLKGKAEAARAVLDSAEDMGAMGTFGGVVLTLVAFKEPR